MYITLINILMCLSFELLKLFFRKRAKIEFIKKKLPQGVITSWEASLKIFVIKYMNKNMNIYYTLKIGI